MPSTSGIELRNNVYKINKNYYNRARGEKIQRARIEPKPEGTRGGAIA